MVKHKFLLESQGSEFRDGAGKLWRKVIGSIRMGRFTKDLTATQGAPGGLLYSFKSLTFIDYDSFYYKMMLAKS